MSRTIAILVDAWRLWLLWRHNHKYMIRQAKLNARYYTNLGIRCDESVEFLDPAPEVVPESANPFVRYKDFVERLNDAG